MNHMHLSDEQADRQAALIANSCTHAKCASPHCTTTISIGHGACEKDKYCRACQSMGIHRSKIGDTNRQSPESLEGNKAKTHRKVLKLNQHNKGERSRSEPDAAPALAKPRLRRSVQSAVDAFEYLAGLSAESVESTKESSVELRQEKPVERRHAIRGRGYLSANYKRKLRESSQSAV